MRKDLTDITLVVDRSGSMSSIREDAEGGVNELIRQQQNVDGEALITLVEFDTKYDFVERGTPAENVKPYQLIPRGGTALLDAIGRAIEETGARIANMAEKDRPGLVIFVVATDGCENSSQEFGLKRIRTMIEHQQSKYSWQFTFLGADQDAFAEAGAMGFAAPGVAQVRKSKLGAAFGHTNEKVVRMRCAAMQGDSINNAYSEEEIRDMESED